MSVGGAALMAVGHGTGENRAEMAAQQALSSEMLDVTIDGARGILFNVTGGPNLSLFEINTAASIIRETAHPDVNLIFGAVIDENMGDEIRITVIATGFDHGSNTPMRQFGGHERRSTSMNRPTQQPVRAAASQPKPASPPPPAREAPPRQAPQRSQPSIRTDDLDIPAFLRKRK